MIVTLITGEAVDSASAEWRHETEARMGPLGYTIRWFCEYLHSGNSGAWTASVRSQQEAVVAANANVHAHNNDGLTIDGADHYLDADKGHRQGDFDSAIAAA